MTLPTSVVAVDLELRCEVCGDLFTVCTMRSTHPEAPELFHPSSRTGAWVGFIPGEKEGHVTMIGCCTLACAHRFFEERG